jgi:hypothetical protein
MPDIISGSLLENDGRAIYKGSFIEGELSRNLIQKLRHILLKQRFVFSFAEALPVSWIEAMAMEKLLVAYYWPQM